MNEATSTPAVQAPATEPAPPVPVEHSVRADRISELYRGEIFSDDDIRIARDRIHWMCAQCEGDTILDVGCSQGIASILLAREGFKVTAIDSHPESVAFARAELARETPTVQSRLSIVETDLATLAEGPGFDSILLGEVIEHQARPERLLMAAKSRLNPRGRMIVTTPFGLHPDPDHKVSLFPSDLVRYAKQMGMGISRLQVDGSYMRCVYEADADPALPYPGLDDLLDRTQRATLDAEQRLHRLLGQRAEQLKQRSDAQRITQRKLAEATTALDERTQALKITQRKLAESTAALAEQERALGVKLDGAYERLRQTGDQLAQTTTALDEKNQALKITQRKLAESTAALAEQERALGVKLDGAYQRLRQTGDQLAQTTTALDEKNQALKITQRKLAESTAALAEQERALGVKLDGAYERLRQTGDQLAQKTTALDEKNQALETAQRKLAEQERDSTQQRTAQRQTQQRLERQIEVRDTRLQAVQRRLAAVTERNERIVASTSHRIGKALVGALQSPGTALRLPADLWAIYRDAKRRQAQRRKPTEVPASGAPALRVSSNPLAPGGEQAEVPASRPTAPSPAARQPELAPAAARQSVFPTLPTDPKRLKVAAVMDEFTFHSFAPECELLALRPQSWEAELAGFVPDLVFIESAWRGADDLWTKKVSNPSAEIMGVIAWCAGRGVPSVFWNKEDPVHYGGFQHIAKAVDCIFTTDVDCIPRYKRDVGHDRVYLLPFAAQPALHNPIESFERQDAFCFAGSYYLKYPERQRDFKSLMDVVSQLRPVEIYDRNYHKPHPHYEFPPEYGKYIVGSLPFDQIDKAYKGYRFGINMNTIKQSQTMFARRVFELLASNTIVVSNFSRGVRLLFGDLVVCSDAPAELERRLTALCSNEARLRKFRLAGVRKVMAEHTYAHRLAYVASKVRGIDAAGAPTQVVVIACAANAAEIERVLGMFRAQHHAARHMVLVTRAAVDTAGMPVEVVDPDSIDRLREVVAHAAWVAPWSAADYYGPNYLTDLALATRFSAAAVLGKGAFHDGSSGTIQLLHDGAQYRPIPRLAARSAMAQGAWLAGHLPVQAAALADLVLEGGDFLAIDEFNYCRDASQLSESGLSSRVDDESGWSQGVSLDADLLPLVEGLQPSTSSAASDGDARSMPGKSAEELAALLPQRLPAGVFARLVDGVLELRSKLAADTHRYLYLSETFGRADLNLEINSRIQLVVDELPDGIDLRTVFEFLDADKRKLSHAMQRIGAAQSMAIPAQCRFVRFGLRIQGACTLRIRRLVLADLRERPSALVPTARHLIVTKQYPDYDDLYRYGFVHSRVRGYRRRGLVTDIFRLHADEPCAFREFEDVDVVRGDRDLLDLALRGSRYEHVLVHLLDAQMWEALARHIDRIRITVWVHGAEIQTWQRRAFEFEGLDEAEIARRKALSDQRAAFWRRLLGDPHPNLSLIFVSRYVADEAQRDLGVDLSRVPHRIIHNFIDGELFSYHAKDAAQRSSVLSIRPFASRTYANDLTVRAILLLSERPCFADLSFHIVGDGELFDETTRPLAGLSNVKLHKGFLTQREIAALHRQHGVFLCPTRMDTQGVSRDEAMASGLVPITTRIAAVPEFVDDTCGILADPEDARQLADAIEALHADPQRFLRLSQAAASRVRQESGFEQTIGRELDWLQRPAQLLEKLPGGPHGSSNGDSKT